MTDTTGRDTESPTADEAVRRAFDRAPYRAVVEDMTELIVRWRPDGTRVFVNDAYCRLFGLSRAAVIGTSFWPLITDEDREEVRARIGKLSPDRPVSTGRHRAHGADGRSVWMEWTDRALFDDAGQVTEYQSVGRDITVQVELQERLRRVERADAVARASAAIAHDLANLLQIVGGQVGLALEEDPSTELETAMAAVEKATGLLDQLRRLRYGRTATIVDLDLNERIRDAAGLLREVAGPGPTVDFRLSGDPCVVRGDPTQIDQVLLNLVKNASEAAPRCTSILLATDTLPAGRLRPGHRWTDSPPALCRVLEVCDDAGGIPAMVLPRIFEPHVSTKAPGRGLGLATVMAVMLGHGGSVSVESSPDGSCFELAFPVPAA